MEAGPLALRLTIPRRVRKDLLAAESCCSTEERTSSLRAGRQNWKKPPRGGLKEQVKTELAALSRRLFGKADRSTVQRTSFATLDLPLAAVRQSLEQGTPLPFQTEALIERAYLGLIKD